MIEVNHWGKVQEQMKNLTLNMGGNFNTKESETTFDDSKPTPFTEDEKSKILELSEQGLSSRKICQAMGWKVTRKSTVNYFLASHASNCNIDISYSGGCGDKKLNDDVRILFWDLESSLMSGYFFKVWDENIPNTRVTKYSQLLTASWAFNDGDVESVRVAPEDVRTGNDLDIVVAMIQAINKADVVVTFNGKRFDTKLLNTRAMYWGLPPIKPVKHIDLYEQAKRVFKFPSNSMQSISMYLGEHGKLATSGSQLWERCANWENINICNNALAEMETYNRGDIVATRDLYYRFQGWMKGLPNLATIAHSNTVDVGSTVDIGNNDVTHKALRCTHCASFDVKEINEQTYTSTSSFKLYRCYNDSCRGISRITRNGKNLVGVI